jgi:hypothetical protein
MASPARFVATIAAALLTVPATVVAQAQTPKAGTGTASVSLQSIDHTGHRLTDGTYVDNGRSHSGALFLDLEYGASRRLALDFSLPFVFARYTDDVAPPPFLPFLPLDQCRCWHAGWQDVGIGARLNVIDTFDHVLVVTPLISAGLPSHDYAHRGEAVLGRHLKELKLGLDASYRLDAISPSVSVSGHYAYAIVERVLDIPNNRSNADAALHLRVASNWAVGGFVSWQRTHGGLRVGSLPGSPFPAPGDLTTPELLAEHDRLLRDDRTHVGADVSYRLGNADVFASFTSFVTGTDTHAGRAITTGVTLPFRLRRRAP